MTTKEKIVQYLEFKGLGKRDFYRTTGFSNGFLDSGKHIGSDNLKIIIDNYSDLSLDWLVLDTGEMIKTKNAEISDLLKGSQKESQNIDKTKNAKNVTLLEGKQNTFPYQVNPYLLKTDSKKDTQVIPLYNMEASAGLVQLLDNHNNQKPTDYISIPNLPNCDGALFVTGDSMYPLLKSGDIIAYKQIQDFENDIFWGEMYLISVDVGGEELVTVKYVQKSEKEGYIKLVSQNKNHQDKDVKISKIRALAIVKASIRYNMMT